MSELNPFKWRHFQAEIILLCVRWYLRYSLSYRDKAFQSSACSASGNSPVGETKAAPSLPATPLASQLVPRVINTEKNATYPKAIAELKAVGMLPEYELLCVLATGDFT